MAFRPQKPPSDFTKRALTKNVIGIEQYSGFSDSYLYAILSGSTPDHLDYARDIHRALCVVDPTSAREYRSLLEVDARVNKGSREEVADDLSIKKLCDDLTTTLQMRTKGQAEDKDVRSAALRLAAVLGCLLSVPEEAEIRDERPRQASREFEGSSS